MKVIIITQNDKIFLPDALDYFFRCIPDKIEIIGCVILEQSPFAKKKSKIIKFLSLIKIFGFKFVIKYSFITLIKLLSDNSILRVLKNHNIKKIDIKENVNSRDSLKIFSSLNPNLIISITSNQIFKKSLINLPSLGILNLHSSLLPKYRGLLPSFWAMYNKDAFSGVTVFFVDEGIDTGKILIQKKIRINGLSHKKLVKLLKTLGMDALIESLNNILNNSINVNTFINDDCIASYNKFPTRDDVKKFITNGNKFF